MTNKEKNIIAEIKERFEKLLIEFQNKNSDKITAAERATILILDECEKEKPDIEKLNKILSEFKELQKKEAKPKTKKDLHHVEILETVAKIYLSVQYAEGLLLVVKHYLAQRLKQKANTALSGCKSFCKTVENMHTDESIEYAEDDVEMFSKIIDAFIQAEYKGVKHQFINDFYGICTKNGC